MTIESRIGEVIAAFDAQGWHRTGTDVDAASGLWFAGELEKTGARTSLETYRFRRLVPGDAFVEVGSRRFDGLPMFDSTPTSPAGVEGRLGAADGGIALIPWAAGGQAPELEKARASSALGVVVPTTGTRVGLAPRNANRFREPFGGPAVQVSGADLNELLAASERGERARLVSTFNFEETHASNVVGIVPGTEPSLAPVCVMTPRSGWWECASERGGGIFCLLELARAITAARPRRTAIFVGTTGHELGHWGLEEFLFRRPGLDTAAALWIHFGASVGAALDPQSSLFGSSAELKDQVLACLTAAGARLPTRTPDGRMAGGESRQIHQAGGRYVSLAGGSAVFHLRDDRWPDAVDVGQVAAVATGMTAFVRQAVCN